jgi:hypothetical protein
LTTFFVLALAFLASTSAVPTAHALGRNTIAETAIISSDGRHALVTALITPEGQEVVLVQLTVTQASGAQAAGRAEGTSTGSTQEWPVRTTVVRGTPVLEPGPARVEAVAIARARGQLIEVRRWGRDITLVAP